MSVPPGTARISLGDNFLAACGDNVAVRLGQEKDWAIQTVDSDSDGAIAIVSEDVGGENLCLTLDSNPTGDSDAINIFLRPLQSPPIREQMWRVEDAIMQPRFPPIVYGRLQSVAKPDLSLAIGGNVPLPRIYMNVAAMPRDGGSDQVSFRWRFDYIDMS